MESSLKLKMLYDNQIPISVVIHSYPHKPVQYLWITCCKYRVKPGDGIFLVHSNKLRSGEKSPDLNLLPLTYASGSLTVNTAPFPVFSASMVPPCFSTAVVAIERPIPWLPDVPL
jgi:hypothetical protein